MEITDEMVERGARYFKHHPQEAVVEAHKLAARTVLELALNPRQEPKPKSLNGEDLED